MLHNSYMFSNMALRAEAANLTANREPRVAFVWYVPCVRPCLPALPVAVMVLQVLAHVPPMQRERVAQVLMTPGYLRKVLDLFRVSTARHSRRRGTDSRLGAGVAREHTGPAQLHVQDGLLHLPVLFCTTQCCDGATGTYLQRPWSQQGPHGLTHCVAAAVVRYCAVLCCAAM